MFIAIVPAYNEEKHIGFVVRNLFCHVDNVVVVDDSSTDNTSKIAKEAGAVVIRHEINRGQGASLETGHQYARSVGATHVIHFDGDGQFDVMDIKPALEKMKNENIDVILGSRFLGKESNIPFFKKKILFPIGRIINKIFAKIKITDVHNGFRIINQNALNKIIITHDGMAHATEILAQIKHHNLKYIEYPVQVEYRKYGQGLGGGVKIVKDLFFSKFI